MNVNVIDAILELETLGYQFTVNGDKITYVHHGVRPDPMIVRPLQETIKANREEALEWLRDDAPAFRVDCLLNAADRAETEARNAATAGDLTCARHHWQRFARFFAAFAELAGATEPTIPWDEWINSFDEDFIKEN